MIETNTSNLAKREILSQLESDRKWHPLAFLSERFLPIEIHYNMYNKELVVIVNCFEKWQHFLIECPYKIIVYTDHKYVEY